ncbi:MAG: hypothetical protein QOI35_3071 [Cryptosporangiaceae bacterium]|nr:hypothetical protein [Cryptosporangiaceae bacterium]
MWGLAAPIPKKGRVSSSMTPLTACRTVNPWPTTSGPVQTSSPNAPPTGLAGPRWCSPASVCQSSRPSGATWYPAAAW